MTREIDNTDDDDWEDEALEESDDLEEPAIDMLEQQGYARAARPMDARLNWRLIEEIREQKFLRAQLEDFDNYVI